MFILLNSSIWADVLRNGYFQNFVFFALDILLLSIAVPYLVKRAERKRAEPTKIGAIVRTHNLIENIADQATASIQKFKNRVDAYVLGSILDLSTFDLLAFDDIKQKILSYQIYVNTVGSRLDNETIELLVSINDCLGRISTSIDGLSAAAALTNTKDYVSITGIAITILNLFKRSNDKDLINAVFRIQVQEINRNLDAVAATYMQLRKHLLTGIDARTDLPAQARAKLNVSSIQITGL